MLTLWNTLHRSLEEFKPIKGKNVGLYTCGPTVYNPATIGNLRTYIFEDILKRTLILLGYKVHHVMNITDVGHLVGDGDTGDDKVEKEAAKQGRDAWEIAKQYEKMFDKDMMRLNIIAPVGKDRPHATAFIKQQIALIEKLEDKGLTYRISDGIYFDTKKFDGYGKLSGQRIGDKQSGVRIELNREKKHPTDFALWKFSPADSVRQMEWNSPWGRGFPGWHVECSAMAEELLGQPFDIHCGGVDHIAVHHENEIAQSEGAYDKPLANYWLHGEFLLVDGGRMGKSEGNAYLLDDLIKKGFDPLAYRFYCLGAHYRSKLNFTWEGMEGAQNALRKLQAEARRLPSAKGKAKGEWIEKFSKAMSDDLNTSEALAVVWEMLKSKTDDKEKSLNLLAMDEVLGLGLADVLGKPIKAPANIVELAEERQQARAAKDWAKSDELRDAIKAKGWLIEDGKNSGYDLQPLS